MRNIAIFKIGLDLTHSAVFKAAFLNIDFRISVSFISFFFFFLYPSTYFIDVQFFAELPLFLTVFLFSVE